MLDLFCLLSLVAVSGSIQSQIYHAASPASPNHVPNEGLAYWSSFNGVAEDESGNSISAAAYGPQPTADRHGDEGMAMAFDGQDDYVLLYADEGGTSFGESLTLAAWVRPQVSSLNGSHPRIFNSTEGVGGGPDRWLFTWSPPLHGEKMQFEVDPSTGDGPYGSTPLPVGQWSHVAVTFDQGEVQFYLNGEADGTATLATTSLAHVSAPIQIGSANGNGFFQGDIDEVGIWSRALDATEIQALQLDGESVVEPVPSGCELFSIQTLAMQNLILLDSIAALNAALANASSNASGDDTNEWSCGNPLTYWDYDYATVLIGDQCWFAENLKTAVYENGDAIAAGLTDGEWTSTTSGATSTYGEGSSACYESSPDIDACDEVESLQTYGRLYNWYAVNDSRGMCPSDWHVPSDPEWTTLVDHVGAQDFSGSEGTALKAESAWSSGGNGTNDFGFTALPGGHRFQGPPTAVDDGTFNVAGYAGYWWSTTALNNTAWRYAIYTNNTIVGREDDHLQFGFSVRCVKD